MLNKNWNNKDTEINSWQFSRNFEDVSPFIIVNIHSKIKQLKPNKTRILVLNSHKYCIISFIPVREINEQNWVVSMSRWR